jgi:asparagine synthetase B (glutamine-hydrolysing)
LLSAEPATTPTPAELVELIATQIPGRESRLSVPLSGGRDSRLLAALAREKVGRPFTAWTTSTDDGVERDLALAGPVADTLGLDHRLVVPGPEAWLENREEVWERVQYQTWYHTWLMPLARMLHRHGHTVLDGLAGDLLFGGEHFINEELLCQKSATQRVSLLARLCSRRLNEARLMDPKALDWIRQSVTSTFLADTHHLDGHREMLVLCQLATRTGRAIALSPMCLLAPEADVRVPFVHPEVIATVLGVPLERRVTGRFYRELLVTACGPLLASFPTTIDPDHSGQRVYRRQTSRAALEDLAKAINSDEPVRRTLGVELLQSLNDSGYARVARSSNARIILQWAAMFAAWRQRYAGRLVWSGSVFGDT